MEYQVKYINDKNVLSKFYKDTICKPYRIVGVVVIIIALLQFGAVLSAKTGFIDLSFSQKSLVMIIGFGIVELLIGLILCMYHIVVANMVMKKGLKIHGGDMPMTEIQMGHEILMIEGSSRMTYNYKKITVVRESKSAFYLMMGKYAGIILPKWGFVKGEPEQFASWIENVHKRIVV